MGLKDFIDKIKERRKLKIEEGSWVKCEKCKTLLYIEDLIKNLKICPHCGYTFRMSAKERVDLLLDKVYTYDLFPKIVPVDPLNFKDTKRYKDRLKESKEKTGLNDAIIIANGLIYDREVVIAAMDFEFMGGSMGSVVGAKFVRGVEYSIQKKIPFISVAASGGARMQESILSLMQMAKTAIAIDRLNKNGILYISILTDPTMGGVSASFAFLGDIIIAEPESLIGFAGPRVIEQTIRQQLPEGFQRAEFLLEKGQIDMVVDRKNLKKTVYTLIKHTHG
ncbi:MAG: acetyl-CoA carboxylase, carboxyltransferase subunit beta [Sulfurihydrogenibium sp.]|jgi:acetyl-CoA carboxylase carboxyl transferase subunit beta|uniref:Acetyl-coenzyme A carboxylase carboxyl transferase subunit beta n=1 Tax=Sulfurihydrogenibium azorense TaxID=309806 RepID=A0A831YB11_9AQUI|nr:MAG: acetyl-CoA carboxylase carboxyl transferase subunit beta [Sulfurihydrogenibium sp.]PMP76758.1 MAG: acetyl-CoA carboxylase carboxyl transferase subunit beta [Sulfurihydrogenibium sp.]HEV09400.1 acetyl-CoA carboxylase carboxyltransferase subunit beta [Sulfurihydrogenibium azorense]